MQLSDPGFLLLALPAALFWFGPLAARDRVHGAIRSLAWLLVVFALARPVQVMGGEQPPVRVAVLDRSESVSAEGDMKATQLLAAAMEQESSARWTVIEIAAPGRENLALDDGVRHIRMGVSESTPLGQGLFAAARVLPEAARDARVTVFSDGLDTEDAGGAHWAGALDAIAGRGATLELVQLDGVQGDLRVVGFDIPDGLRAGREVLGCVRLTGDGQTVSCTARGPQGDLVSVDGIRVDGDTAVPLTFVPPEAGFMEIDLEVTVTAGSDPVDGDLSFATTVPVLSLIHI